MWFPSWKKDEEETGVQPVCQDGEHYAAVWDPVEQSMMSAGVLQSKFITAQEFTFLL